MKKILSAMIILFVCMSFSTNIYAMDKKVKSSKAWTVVEEITKKEANENSKYWKKGYLKGKAKGYIEASARHYANVVLCVNKTPHEKESGRVWGTGKVNVDTGWDKKINCFLDMYYAHIYYGF